MAGDAPAPAELGGMEFPLPDVALDGFGMDVQHLGDLLDGEKLISHFLLLLYVSL